MSNIIDRFFKKVIKKSDDECWEWTGGTNNKSKHPYGQFRMGDKRIQAHRLSYILKNGEIPDGKIVLHECDNTLCVNPAHLNLGTPLENTTDMINKGRQYTKLKKEDVDEIKSSPETNAELSRKYGVTPSTIYDVRHNKTWGKK